MPNNISKKASCFVFLLAVLIVAAGPVLAQVAQPDNNVEPAAGRLAKCVGAIVGKALEPLAKGKGLIKVRVC